MDYNFNRKEKIVGTFLISITILLLATVVIIGRGKDWFKTYVTYYTVFNESYNLETNTPVKLYKATIGKVKNITLVGNKVKVTLTILEEFSSRIRSNSFVIVESPTFVGSEYVSIKPGSADFPQVPEDGLIPSRAKKSISDILSEFQVEKTAKMVVGAAQDLSELIQILKNPQGPFFTILENINRITVHIKGITGDVQDGKGTIGSILKSRDLIEAIHDNLDSIYNNLDKVGSILDNIDRASEKVPGAMEQVQDNLTSFKKIGDGVTDSITDVKNILKDVKDAVGTLKTILTNIEKGSEDVPQITQSVKGGIREIRNGVDNIDKVVQSLQQNFLIRPNLPPEPEGQNIDAGLRE